MIGGIVIEVIDRENYKELTIRDKQYKDTCKKLIPLRCDIQFGEEIWWQAGVVIYKRNGRDTTIPIIIQMWDGKYLENGSKEYKNYYQ